MTILIRLVPLYTRQSAWTSLHSAPSTPTTRSTHTTTPCHTDTSLPETNLYKETPQPNELLATNHHYVNQFFPGDQVHELTDMAGNKGGYYAVQKGRQPGIYKTWAECEAATKGFSGAVFKKFSTQADAQEFVRSDGYGSTSYPSLGGHSLHPSYEDPPPPRNVIPTFSNRAGSASGRIVVYCDGSSIGNGTSSARAGWAVYFEDPNLHHLNEARRLPGPTQTNNRAELTAIIRAIQLCPNNGRELVILSDSKYSIDAVTKWLPAWKQNNWRTSSGGDVQNQDLVQELDREMCLRLPTPKLAYIQAHSGHEGNETADRMAKYGASLPEVD